jgi:3-deoxy-D-manno-octulosonic-acid transferase
MRWVANLCYLVAALIYLPRLLYEMVLLKKNRGGWTERRGHLRRLSSGRPRVWIHAVSLGEMNATRSLVASLRERRPDCEVVLSTTTDTGYARGRELYPDLYVFRYPLDLSWIVFRAMDRIKPSLIILVELELWHNLSSIAAARGIPVAIFNGRLSERSSRRYKLIGGLVRSMFARVTWVGAQDAAYAGRFEELGVPRDRITVTGSVKYDTAPTDPNVPGVEELRADLGLPPAAVFWVCGSTGPGEEEIILRAYTSLRERCPDLWLSLVPRKPERFDDVARVIEKAGYACFRRSAPQARRAIDLDTPDRRSVILGDTMGELRKFYALSTVAFVGRSLVPMGGSDVIEAAALSKPILVGPHVDNFADAVSQLRAKGGIVITQPDQLAEDVGKTIEDREFAARLSRNARAVVQENLGATARALDALVPLLLPTES